MRHHSVKNSEQALVWMTDCTLATVEGLAMRSRPPKGELDRQIEIAQQGIDWIKQMGITPTDRPAEIIEKNVSVREWANS